MRTFKRLKSFFSSGENGWNIKREKKHVAQNALQRVNKTLHIRSCSNHVCDTLTSQTLRRNAIASEMDVISTLTTLTYLATGKMQLCSSDDLGLSQPSISKVITQTFIALSELYFVTVHFLIFFKYDSIVNNIYTYVMGVSVCEREYGKTGNITHLIEKRRRV